MSIELLSTGDVAMTADDVMDSDDADWYRQEVGAEPDPGKLRRRKIQLLHLWTATRQTLPIIFLGHLSGKNKGCNFKMWKVSWIQLVVDLNRRKCDILRIVVEMFMDVIYRASSVFVLLV